MKDIQSTLSYNWFQKVWNQGNKNAIDELLAHDTVAHGIGESGKTIGREAFKQFFDGFRKDFSDIHVDVEDVITQDDMESARCTVTATHVPTGKPVKFSGMSHTRIENGQIAEGWNEYNFLGMYQQLGFTLAEATLT